MQSLVPSCGTPPPQQVHRMSSSELRYPAFVGRDHGAAPSSGEEDIMLKRKKRKHSIVMRLVEGTCRSSCSIVPGKKIVLSQLLSLDGETRTKQGYQIILR
jgi:hypothetical protein